MQITSPQNPKIKEIIKLRKAGKRKKEGFIIIEGQKEIELALAGRIIIEEFYYCFELSCGKKPPKVFDKYLVSLSTEVFKKISYRKNPDGWLALAQPRGTELSKIKLSDNPLLLVLEAIEKPGNLGAILRTADAAGIDAVLICDPKTDIYNPNVIRASRGTVFTVKSATDTKENILAWLKEGKIRVFATTPKADKFHTEQDYTRPSAIVIGSEKGGLSDYWHERADEKIKIPMKGKIDSLNASVSAAVVVYEALRQRK